MAYLENNQIKLRALEPEDLDALYKWENDAIRDYAFDFLLVKQLYAHIPKQNEISLKLFSKAGYSNTACLKEWIKTSDGFEDVSVVQLINEKLKI